MIVKFQICIEDLHEVCSLFDHTGKFKPVPNFTMVDFYRIRMQMELLPQLLHMNHILHVCLILYFSLLFIFNSVLIG